MQIVASWFAWKSKFKINNYYNQLMMTNFNANKLSSQSN